MEGTVVLTGANGSLGLGFVEHFLASYPSLTLVATVRNADPESDPNTARLCRLVAENNDSQVQIETLDLSSIASVRNLANNIAKRVVQGQLPPIVAIVCNAFSWSLTGQQMTTDGYERTFQVGHLSHYLLVLKLLGSMAPHGRVVMLGSTVHFPEHRNPLSNLTAEFPSDIDLFVHPSPDETGQEHDRGFQRYGTTKLANVMFMHDLNKRLAQDPELSGITVTAMDPGGLVDSRGNSIQRPVVRVMFAITSFFMPLLRHMTSNIRRSSDSGADLVELSLGERFKSAKGYFIGQKGGDSSETSKDTVKQKILWDACWKWARLTPEETALAGAER